MRVQSGQSRQHRGDSITDLQQKPAAFTPQKHYSTADICVFSPSTILRQGRWSEIKHVFVNNLTTRGTLWRANQSPEHTWPDWKIRTCTGCTAARWEKATTFSSGFYKRLPFLSDFTSPPTPARRTDGVNNVTFYSVKRRGCVRFFLELSVSLIPHKTNRKNYIQRFVVVLFKWWIVV